MEEEEVEDKRKTSPPREFKVRKHCQVQVKLFGLWLNATLPETINVSLTKEDENGYSKEVEQGLNVTVVSWKALTLMVDTEDMEEMKGYP